MTKLLKNVATRPRNITSVGIQSYLLQVISRNMGLQRLCTCSGSRHEQCLATDVQRLPTMLETQRNGGRCHRNAVMHPHALFID